MATQIIVYPHCGILLSRKRKTFESIKILRQNTKQKSHILAINYVIPFYFINIL